MAEDPTVSIIVPCYNEQATIRLLLEALYAQTYPRSRMEVIIADGMSQDQTRKLITGFSEEHPDLQIKLVDNTKRIIPAALNRALEAVSGEIVVRLDAHSAPRIDYVERAVKAITAGLGDNVGGVWEIRPRGSGWQARSIAAAASHPLGVGDAQYRYAEQPGEVDTVPFGAFRKSLLDKIGAYDENLLTNEDYEYNVRIRQAGGKIWLDPSIRTTYYARPTFGSLAQQYWRYGFWKFRMLRRFPKTIRWRQALPPLLVAGVLGALVLGFFFPPLHWLLWLVLAGYALGLLVAGTQTALKHEDIAMLIGVPAAIAVMHFSWGGGFLWSILNGVATTPSQSGETA